MNRLELVQQKDAFSRARAAAQVLGEAASTFIDALADVERELAGKRAVETQSGPKKIRVRDIASDLGVSTATVYAMIDASQIPGVSRIYSSGNASRASIRIDAKAYAQWRAAQESAATRTIA